MVWATVVAALLGASAHLVEIALRDRGWPTRWGWAAAVTGSVGLPAWAMLRPATMSAGSVGSEVGGTIVDPAWLADVGSAAVAGVGTVGERLDDVLLIGWVVSATVATAALLGGLGVLRNRAARWHRARVHGQSVLLSGDFGPAVVGVMAPEIVLPRWALRLPAEDLRLACLHEAEHRDAHDTWLLFAAALVAALVPWNVALWWQMRRLRAAVELDCDARVLGRGVPKRAYGALLLELGSARSQSPLPVLAFAKPRSLLERRLKMIVRNVRERRPIRSLAAVCVGAALLVVACETPAPTTVDEGAGAMVEEGAAATAVVNEEPSGSTEGGVASGSILRRLSPAGLDLAGRLGRGSIRFFVDDVEQREVPADLEASTIDRVELQKDPDGEAGAVYVYTRDRGEPLIYVDGIRLEGDLSSISPDQVERIEILKGEAATAVYGPAGAAGVVQIKMKEPGGRTTPR